MRTLGDELAPGLRRWSAHHPEWKEDVGSIALVRPDELVLIDPLLGEAQWPALTELAAARRPHVLLTVHWHARSAAEIAARLPGCRVWANSRGKAAMGRRVAVTDVFRAGDPLPAAIVAFQARPRSEVVFWDPRGRALILGDALLGDGEAGRGLRTCPAWWLPQSSSIADLRAALRPLLDLPVELVLPSHGAPILSSAGDELARVL